jgi:hypothetical protein
MGGTGRMTPLSTVEEELKDFLWCTFNQNMLNGNPDDALDDFMLRNSKQAITDVADYIDKYLNNKSSNAKKTEFIESNCAIWFEGIKNQPLKWLAEVQIKLNTAAKNKK